MADDQTLVSQVVTYAAKTIRIEGDAGDQGRRLNGSSGSSAASGTILSTRQQAHPGQTRARVLIDYKHRIAGRDADWTPGSMATLTGGLITLDTAVCEIGSWDGKGSTIKPREGHLVPVEPADFEAGRIGKLDAEQGEHAYPIAPGKVFALRFKSGTGADTEALIRICSIRLQNMAATSAATAPR